MVDNEQQLMQRVQNTIKYASKQLAVIEGRNMNRVRADSALNVSPTKGLKRANIQTKNLSGWDVSAKGLADNESELTF